MPIKFGQGKYLGLTETKQSRLHGIFFMVLGMAGMSAVDATAKWLVTSDYSVFQVIAVRGWIIVVIMLIWIAVRNRWRDLKTSRVKGHGFRLAIAFAGPVFMFLALKEMPLADVTVIIFGSAFLTTSLSVPLFKEPVGAHRWAAVAIGFIGVIVALRPGPEIFQPAALYAVLASFSFAGINLTARWLRDTETTFQMVFFLLAGTALLGSLFLPFVWRPIPPGDIAIFIAMAVFTLIGYIGMTHAFVIAPVAVVAPFEYTVLIGAVSLGYFIWGDIPDIFVWTGAAVIVDSGLYVIHRETRRETG